MLTIAGRNPHKKLIIPKREIKPIIKQASQEIELKQIPSVVEKKTIAMIKCVFIREDWPENRRLIKKCIKETYEQNRDVRIIFAVDAAPVEDKEWLKTMGEVIELSEGKPPRMNLLLEKAINMVDDEYVWTCEQDVIISKSERLKAEELVRKLRDDVYALEIRSVDENGWPTYPFKRRRTIENEKIGGYVVWLDSKHTTFSSVIWKTKFMKLIDWKGCRTHLYCDVDVSLQLRQREYKNALCGDIKYVHYPSLSRRRFDHNELMQIGIKYGTDKAIGHNYIKYYYELFKHKRNDVKRVVEIGVHKGASLRMWQEYFPNAQIYGFDIKDYGDYFNKTEKRIKTYVVDQTDSKRLNEIMTEIGEVDIIIDDGSHIDTHQLISLNALYKWVKPFGCYIIEDINPKGYNYGDRSEKFIASFNDDLIDKDVVLTLKHNKIEVHNNEPGTCMIAIFHVLVR
jgi:hypothetical protein